MLEKLSDMMLIPNVVCVILGIVLLIHGEIGFRAVNKYHSIFIIVMGLIGLIGGIVSILTRNQ